MSDKQKYRIEFYHLILKLLATICIGSLATIIAAIVGKNNSNAAPLSLFLAVAVAIFIASGISFWFYFVRLDREIENV